MLMSDPPAGGGWRRRLAQICQLVQDQPQTPTTSVAAVVTAMVTLWWRPGSGSHGETAVFGWVLLLFWLLLLLVGTARLARRLLTQRRAAVTRAAADAAAARCGRLAVPALGFFGGADRLSPLRSRCQWNTANSGLYRVHVKGVPHSIAVDGGCPAIRRLLNEQECRAPAAGGPELSGGMCLGCSGSGVSKHFNKASKRPIPALLHDSLTQADAAAWPRQRRAVKRAVGSGGAVARSFSIQISAAAVALGAELREAVAAAAAAAATHPPACCCNLQPPVYRAAARALCEVVLGREAAVEAAEALVRLWSEGRNPYGQRMTAAARATCESAAADLRAAVDRTYDRLVAEQCAQPMAEAESEAGQPPTTLLERLAAQVASASVAGGGDGGGLSRVEACANAHSFMLAGFETSAATTLFTLLHFAHATAALQHEATVVDEGGPCPSGGAVGSNRVVAGAVQESLRLYPPVLTLPRVVTAPDGLAVRLPHPPPLPLPQHTLAHTATHTCKHTQHTDRRAHIQIYRHRQTDT